MVPFLILIADRDRSRVAAYRAALAGERHVIVSADSAEQCLALLRNFTPDVFVLDADMPGAQRIMEVLCRRLAKQQVAVIVQAQQNKDSNSLMLASFRRCERHARPLPPPRLAKRLRRLLPKRAPWSPPQRFLELNHQCA